MVVPEHEAEWPDKAMFAGILLTVSGALAVLFSLLRFTEATFGEDIPVLFQDWPTGIMLPAAVITLVLGIVATRHQSAAALYGGSVFGIVSMAGLGVVPLLCLFAVGFMVKAHLEGEDTTLATPTPNPDDWPDKALAASLMLFVIGVVTLFQGALTFTGTFAPVLFGASVWGLIATIIGVVCLWSARQVFHLRRAWAGTVGAIVGFLGLGLYIVGPVLAVIALVLLARAGQEEEFLDPIRA